MPSRSREPMTTLCRQVQFLLPRNATFAPSFMLSWALLVVACGSETSPPGPVETSPPPCTETVSFSDAVQWMSTFVFDDDRRVVAREQVDAQGATISSYTATYSAEGKMAEERELFVFSGNDVRTTYVYADGGLSYTATTTTNGVETEVLQVTLNAAGLPEREERLTGQVLVYSYDDRNQVTEIRDGSGMLVSSFTYDADGRLLHEDTGALRITSTYEDDRLVSRQRVERITGIDRGWDEYRYDSERHLVSETLWSSSDRVSFDYKREWTYDCWNP